MGAGMTFASSRRQLPNGIGPKIGETLSIPPSSGLPAKISTHSRAGGLKSSEQQSHQAGSIPEFYILWVLLLLTQFTGNCRYGAQRQVIGPG